MLLTRDKPITLISLIEVLVIVAIIIVCTYIVYIALGSDNSPVLRISLLDEMPTPTVEEVAIPALLSDNEVVV